MFHSMYSDHQIDIQCYRCSKNDCTWTETFSIKKILSSNMHVDLVKAQSEFGARHSYRMAAKDIKSLIGVDRKINNKSRIHRTTNKIGKILENKKIAHDVASEKIEYAKKLTAVVDGGHVHDANHKGHNFEAMVSKIFKPENLVQTDKHHTKIIKKHVAASAKSDAQETMKQNVVEAAIKEGADKNTTEITVLADGAKNCWNIAEVLKSYCLYFIFILDWFHIGKYVQNLIMQLPDEYKATLLKIKEQLWIGKPSVAIILLNQFQLMLKDPDHIKKLENFIGYITDNEKNIVNYQERKNSGLIYSSHIAESTVEHMINERSKRKQKMQWSRDGLHAVLQIRSSQVSDEWKNDWNNVILPALKIAA